MHFSTAGHAFHLATPTSVNSTAPPTATRPSLPHFSFSQIQSADVLKELQNLDPYKSAGLDNLDPLFLKLSAEIVATPITSLFNLSFVSSEIPKDWKAVIPLAKAFDSVNPHILICRLNSLGFSNDCLAWCTNYFSDRAQCVKSEGLLSGPLAVSMGVPHQHHYSGRL